MYQRCEFLRFIAMNLILRRSAFQGDNGSLSVSLKLKRFQQHLADGKVLMTTDQQFGHWPHLSDHIWCNDSYT